MPGCERSLIEKEGLNGLSASLALWRDWHVACSSKKWRAERETLAMMDQDDFRKIQEEMAVDDTWRKISRHVVADLLEGCSTCSMVRERNVLLRCPWCEDVYLCAGKCMHEHNMRLHPTVTFWSK